MFIPWIILIRGDNGNGICFAGGKHKGDCANSIARAFDNDGVKITVQGKEIRSNELAVDVDARMQYGVVSEKASSLALDHAKYRRDASDIIDLSEVRIQSTTTDESLSLGTYLELAKIDFNTCEEDKCACER